ALPHIGLPCFERVDLSVSHRLGVMFAQIASSDLDVTIIGQLPPSQLPLDRKLEAGSLEVEGFQATLRRWRLIEQSLEHPPRDPHRALVLAELDGELDRSPVVIPASVLWKYEKDHCGLPSCSRIVL